MRRILLSITCLALTAATALAGCSSSVTGTLGDRAITAHTSGLGRVELRTDNQQASLQLGGQTLGVTAQQVTWTGGALPLPPNWRRLRFTTSSGTITVTADGKAVGRIPLEGRSSAGS